MCLKVIAFVVSVISIFIHHSDCGEFVAKEPRRPFYLDSYDDCSRSNKVYCKAITKLIPKIGLNYSDIWETRPSFIKEDAAAKTDKPVHGFCIEQSNGPVDSIFVSNHVANFHYGKPYTTEVLSYSCETDYYEYLGWHDLFVCALFLSYILLIIYATKMDSKWRKHQPEHLPQTVQNIFRALSFERNLKSLFANNDRIYDTKAIQGLRVFMMLEVIGLHTLISYMANYVENFEDLEMTLSRAAFYYLFTPIAIHAVQGFFFISGFLLAIQVNKLNEASKTFKVRDVLVLIINRYARLVVPITVATLFSSTVFELLSTKGVNFDIMENQVKRCRNFWWANIFLISNNFLPYKTCCIWLWYASADFQLYILSLMLIYLMFRFKKHAVVIYSMSMVLAAITHMYIMYTKRTNTISRIINEIRFEDLERSVDLQYLYRSTISNINTYFIGVGFGFLYYRNKGKCFFENTFALMKWWSVSGIFIFLTCYITIQKFSGVLKLIMGSIWKPIYAINVGIFILSLLSRSPSEIRELRQPLKFITVHLKPFLEHSIFQVLAKVAYCTYIFHFYFIIRRVVTTRPVRYSEIGMFPECVRDISIGILVGTIMYLLFEAPANKLQTMFLPQVGKRKSIENGVPGRNPVMLSSTDQEKKTL